jgi:hypothetical protein
MFGIGVFDSSLQVILRSSVHARSYDGVTISLAVAKYR